MLPFLGPIAPPPGIWGTAVAGLQCFAIAGSFANEISNPTSYSKFASGKTHEDPISSRNGMFRIYLPSTITASALTIHGLVGGSNAPLSLVPPLLFLHFSKRSLETAFLHKYSGTMPAMTANGIGSYYALITLLVASTAVPMSDIASIPLLSAGLGLFTIGEIGNFYHHYLLRQLRTKKEEMSNTSSKKGSHYVPPTGGLFRFCAAPHYLMELVAWLGIACAAQQANSFLAFASMASYLGGRAYKTNAMYRKEFTKEEWPESRSAILPGIF